MGRRLVAVLVALVTGLQLWVPSARGDGRPYEFGALVADDVHRVTAVSADGRWVLVGPLLVDRSTGAATTIAADLPFPTTISADGRFAFGAADVAGAVTRWRLPEPGGEPLVFDLADPAAEVEDDGVSATADGARLLLTTNSPVFAEESVYLVDTATGTSTDVTVGLSDGWPQSRGGVITPDGRLVVFSHYDNLATDWNLPEQVVLHDVAAGTNTIVSRSTDGTPANAAAIAPRISPNGRYVTFLSAATNLVADATSSTWRLYLLDRADASLRVIAVVPAQLASRGLVDDAGRVVFVGSGTAVWNGEPHVAAELFEWVDGELRQVTVAPDGSPADGVVQDRPAMSSDGSVVVFLSSASNLAGPHDGLPLAMLRPPAGAGTPPSSTTTTTTTTSSSTTTTAPASPAPHGIDHGASAAAPARRGGPPTG